jgi:hypothetical protein
MKQFRRRARSGQKPKVTGFLLMPAGPGILVFANPRAYVPHSFGQTPAADLEGCRWVH